MQRSLIAFTLLVGCLLVRPVNSAEGDDAMLAYLDSAAGYYGSLARAIWEEAEVGYQEYDSSRLLQETLVESGFAVETGVAGIPTAFMASHGEGGPVIALLAEFDALPGIIQTDSPQRDPVLHHACKPRVCRWGSVRGQGGDVCQPPSRQS